MKLLIAIALPGTLLTFCTGCATSTAGLSKDQITEQQRQNSAWADFGRGVLTIAVNAGVASLGRARTGSASEPTQTHIAPRSDSHYEIRLENKQ